jgi:hypothetical protein
VTNLRLIHFYLGVFFAPLIIFFAFSGSLQVFKLHEAYRDTPGSQGDWIAWFAQMHKEQAWTPPPVAKPRKGASETPAPAKETARSALPMKWFVVLMGAALMVTTLLGLYIAFNYPKRRKGFAIALALGVLVPVVLPFF